MAVASHFRTFEVSDPRFSAEGLHHITVKTPHLRGRGDITVFLPPGQSGPLPLVLLLHGVYGSHWVWAQKAGAHRTAQRLIYAGTIRPIALAMPSDGLFGDGSGYLPHSGFDFTRWIVDDVPTAVQEAFPVVQPQQAGLFVAGLSMGGFGAMRLGGQYPDRFRAFAGHSSITELSQMAGFVEEPLSVFQNDTNDNTSVLATLVANKEQLPPFRFDCGLDDNLLSANRALHAALEKLTIEHTYEEFPGGHEWPYWEAHLEKTLLFFDQKQRK